MGDAPRGIERGSPARVVGRYALYEPLGTGGAAAVFLAVERGDAPAVVAVKLLHEEVAREAAAVARLLDEVRLSRRIQHTNVVRTRDFVSDGTEMLSVMDYVHGEPFSRLLSRARKNAIAVPIAIAAAIVVDVLEGLHAAHEATDADGSALALVHRDVTPENILVGEDGVARLTDFGVAKAEGRLVKTSDGGVRGKLCYLAPEQLGGDVTRHTDIYAAGLVLWEALVGERPIDGDTEAAIVTKALDPKIPPPSTRVAEVPAALDAIVMRALALAPDARFPSAREMAEAIAGAVPLATAADTSSWVRNVAGDVLEPRAQAIHRMLDAESRRNAPSGIMVAATAGISGSVPIPPSAVAVASTPGIGGRVAAAAIGLVAVLLGGGLVLVLRDGGARTEKADPVVSSAVVSPAMSLAPPAVVSASAPAIAVVPPPDVDPNDVAPPSSPSSNVPATASVRATRPAAHASSAKADKGDKGDKASKGGKACDPPWLIDAKGIRRYNPDCLR